MSYPRLALLGAGHLGSALLGGLIAAGYPKHQLIATCGNPQTAAALQQRFSIQAGCDNSAAVAQADTVLFCVKPAVLPKVAAEIGNEVMQRNLPVISTAAGVTVSQLSHFFQDQAAIIRAMPNTPALVGWGATALYANERSNPVQRQTAEQIFASVGSTIWLDKEDYLYAITALSGSGPAYFFLLMQALEEAAQALGLPEHVAKPLIIQTALGSAHMVDKTAQSPAQLCRQVASPGGGTERALKVLESENFRELVVKAVSAAEQRYRQLTEG